MPADAEVAPAIFATTAVKVSLPAPSAVDDEIQPAANTLATVCSGSGRPAASSTNT